MEEGWPDTFYRLAGVVQMPRSILIIDLTVKVQAKIMNENP